MGFSLSWVAFRGRPAEDVRAEVGLRSSDDRDDWRFLGATLFEDWNLLVSGSDDRFIDEALLARLSRGCEVVACFVEEHVMASRATEWRDGRNVWTVDHDSSVAADHLEVTGEAPEALESIRQAAEAKRHVDGDDEYPVDYLFEVPVELAQVLVGFRYDDVFSDHVMDSCDVLVEVPPEAPRKRFWARLLGR